MLCIAYPANARLALEHYYDNRNSTRVILPISGAIHFESGISIHAAQLFDLSGRCVARWSGPGLASITTSDIQRGCTCSQSSMIKAAEF